MALITGLSTLLKHLSKPCCKHYEKQIKGFDRIADTSPEKTASIIIKGILKNRKRQLVRIDAVIIDICCRLMPQGFSNLVGLAFELKEKRA